MCVTERPILLTVTKRLNSLPIFNHYLSFRYDCPYCKTAFLSRVECFHHSEVDHSTVKRDRSFFCEICLKNFLDQVTIRFRLFFRALLILSFYEQTWRSDRIKSSKSDTIDPENLKYSTLDNLEKTSEISEIVRSARKLPQAGSTHDGAWRNRREFSIFLGQYTSYCFQKSVPEILLPDTSDGIEEEQLTAVNSQQPEPNLLI